MKTLILLTLLGLVACTSGPPEFSKPAENAPVWDLNEGEWSGANAMIQPPTLPPTTAGAPLAR